MKNWLNGTAFLESWESNNNSQTSFHWSLSLICSWPERNMWNKCWRPPHRTNYHNTTSPLAACTSSA